MLTVSTIAALAAILAPCAQGHGWITSPMSRALCDNRKWEGIFMPGGGNGAGPGMHDLGGVPGVCGDPFQSMTDVRTNFAEEPCSIQETYTEGFARGISWITDRIVRVLTGSEVTVVVELSNQHGGYFEFAICPMATGLTEDCFTQNILMTESGAEQYWAQPTEKSSSISVDNREVYNVKVQLPPGLTCEHCTLMWTWWTSHMCTYDCDEQVCGAYANFNNPMPTGGSGPPCASDKPSKGETPQMFRACGDVAILPAGGGPAPLRPTTPPATPPTTTPETPEEKPTETEKPAEAPITAPTLPTPETPTKPAAPGACGGMSQPVCTDLTGRQYECDHGYVGMNGYCVPYTAPTAAQMPAGECGGDQQPVCTDFSVRVYECDFGFVGKAGICVPYVMGDSASPTTTPPADPQIKNVVEEEEEKETMPTPPTTTPTVKCGGLGNAACTDGEPCNAGLIPVTGGASTICRRDLGQGRKLSAPMN